VPEIGSYCFIGTLFLSLELQFNEQVANRCGECRRCLEACPTGALLDAHTLDPALYAYLNMKKKANSLRRKPQTCMAGFMDATPVRRFARYNQKWNRPGDPCYGAYIKEFGKSLRTGSG
jgi:epoxyqueuosine reductase QueG